MNAIQSNGSTPDSVDFTGSIQSLNLGSYCVDQVAELINWSNAGSFSLPKRSPWVQIDPVDPPQPAHTPAASAVDQSTPSEESTDLDPDTVPSAAENEDVSFPDTLATQTLERSPGETTDDPKVAGNPRPESTAQSLDTAALEPTDPEISHSAVAEPIVVSVDAQQNSADASPAPTSIKNQIAPAASNKPVDAAGSTSDLMPSRSLASPPIENPPNGLLKEGSDPLETSLQHGEIERSERGRPLFKQAPNHLKAMEALEPMSVKSDHALPGDSSAYLRSLESLVLDLNLQLARVTGDLSDQDASLTTWLRKRVIELSLENMALQEKLQGGSDGNG